MFMQSSAFTQPVGIEITILNSAIQKYDIRHDAISSRQSPVPSALPVLGLFQCSLLLCVGCLQAGRGGTCITESK